MVQQTVLVQRLHNAQGNAQHEGYAQGRQSHTHGNAEFAGHDLRYGHAGLDAAGRSQIAPDQLAVEPHQLDAQGVLQPCRRQAVLLRLIGELDQLFLSEEVVRRQHPQQQKDRRDDNEHRQDGLQQPLYCVLHHRRSPAGASRRPDRMPSTVRGGFVRGAGAQVHRIFLILVSSLNRSVVPNTGEYAALPGGPALRLPLQRSGSQHAVRHVEKICLRYYQIIISSRFEHCQGCTGTIARY